MADNNQSTIIEGTEPNAKLTAIQQLYSKLTEIKDKIKGGGLSQSLFDELSAQAKLIQDKLNVLLTNKRLITQSDVNDAYKTMQDVSRRELEVMNKAAGRKTIIYLAVGVLGVYALYYLLNRKK